MNNAIPTNIIRFIILYLAQIMIFKQVTFSLGGIAYIHTEVPPELAGRGLGSILVRHILDYAQNEGLKVKAVCPFVKAYIDKHPEYQANSVFHQTE